MSNEPEATNERRRHFSILTIENVVQTCMILLGIAVGYGQLSSKVETTARDISSERADRGLLSVDVNSLQTQGAAVLARVQQLEAQQAAFNLSRDSDRKMLMDINAKVEVLLDRTDPKKAKP